jgi:hypothetical protein
MSDALAAFQDAFAQALYRAGGPLEHSDAQFASLFDQPGFAVYRNNVVKACIDALQANFPSVVRLVGAEWFSAAAAVYVRHTAPRDRRLMYYGADFPAFLEQFEPARELIYLGPVARLDQLWMEVHTAEDQATLNAASLAQHTPEALGQLRLHVHAAARWQWFEGQAAYTIWHCNRTGVDVPDTLDWSGEGALLTRPGGAVQWRPLGLGGCAFLDACAAGLPLEAAAQQAADAEPSLDFTTLLQSLFAAEAFAVPACSTEAR